MGCDAAQRSWPRGGHGTLKAASSDVPVHAKTGTLDGVSALSGWVWLEREQEWAEFSILSSGITKARSVHIENAIVRARERERVRARLSPSRR